MKRSTDDLAIFGGAPAFAEPLHVGRPNIGDRERLLERIGGILDRRWLTNAGPCVAEFEQRLAELTGARHAVALCNATVALEVLFRALDLRGEVIVPSFTFVATAHALEWTGATPVFCDVDARTHNLDPACVERLITPRTTAIVGVHVWGRACPVEELRSLADAHSLRLVFDAAHALGCSHGGRPIGGFGDAEVFSFHATKFVNAFEGGAILTDDDEVARRARLLLNFGFAGYDRVVSAGTNGKMSEPSAAMGLTSLEAMDDFIAVNRRNHERYIAAVEGVPGVAPVRYDPGERSNYQYVVLEIDPERAGIERDALCDALWAENVLARRYFHPGCHRMEPYASRPECTPAPLPVTERLSARVLSLPTGTAVTEAEVDEVAGLIRFVIENAAAVRARLAERPRAAGAAAGAA